ncbi:hypothetical protein GX411_01155 [Candidatus Fermentibacteria bacterium]|nr:hypothetical protein [Candidatus Fermentibacteria bacterium]
MMPILMLVSTLLTGESEFQLEAPVQCGGTDAILQYDDGTAQWLSYDRQFSATWFHLEDFQAGATGCQIQATEYWFYHHVGSYHLYWDTSIFAAQVWSGGPSGPDEMIDCSSATAVNFAPVFVDYIPPLQVPADFWLITRHSLWNGSPTPVMDIEAAPGPHSFWRNPDMTEWEPLIGDLLYRVHGNLLGLEEDTWGAIKVLFGARGR